MRGFERLQLVLDIHTSRKNAQTQGKGPECECAECEQIRKAIKELSDAVDEATSQVSAK
jgi:hypothetical protein